MSLHRGTVRTLFFKLQRLKYLACFVSVLSISQSSSHPEVFQAFWCMGKRKVQFKPTSDIRPCPECGNKTDFTIISQQVMEDGCNIWAECNCGYDPSSENTMSRIEDVWGSLNDDNCKDAISYTWNELIDEKQKIK